MRTHVRILVLSALVLPLAWGLTTWGRAGKLETGMNTEGQDAEGGLRFRLSEGTEALAEPRRITPAAAAPLPEGETAAVLSRMKPLQAEDADRQEFALRKGSLPPPLSGSTVQAAFPPAAETSGTVPAPEASSALEVLRFAPEGEVPLAPSISVTFSQPMVALSTHEDLAKTPPPVRLSPEVPGLWRWIGTRTVLFEATAERFPMATEFSVEVPAGTKSTSGGALAEAKRWSFKTPPPQLQVLHPQGGPFVRQPLLFLGFDQHVSPEAVLPTVRVEAAGQNYGLALASADEVAADSLLSSLAANAQAGRWVALRLLEPLPPETSATVTVGPGTPSAEGPRKTEQPASFQFQTYGPLKITESYCGWRNECPPFSPWTVRFSNPLDPAAFDRSQLLVEPELPGLKASLNGEYLTIQGRSAGRTTYKLSIDGSLRDSFGQTLGKSETVSFTVGSAPPMLSGPGGPFVVLDPSGGARYSVYSINHKVLRVSLYAVGPEDWTPYLRYLKELSHDPRAAGKPPGKPVPVQSVEVGAEPDQLAETRIELSAALKDGLGHVIVVVEPPPGFMKMLGLRGDNNPRVITWVQSTRIGLDAFVDGRELLGWASSLGDGKPLEGVSLTLAPAGPAGTTGADGLVSLALPAAAAAEQNVLVARLGADVAILPESTSWWNEYGGWHQGSDHETLRWFVFDDRKMYRPGEEMHLKGWIRRIGSGKKGDVGPVGDAARSVRWQLFDAQGNELSKGTVPLGELGGFDGVFQLPATMNLGYARVDLHAEGGAIGLSNSQYGHSFQVQEFRRPEFEVSASADAGTHLVGGSLGLAVKAVYYAGGGLPGADVNWSVTSTPGSFSPPNWDGFSFGTWTPWWWGEGRHGGGWGAPQGRSEVHAGKTDGSGEHRLRIELLGVDPPQASTLSAEATVMDVNRQAWTAKTSALVHSAEHYIGLKSERTFVQAGEPMVVQAVVADLDGAAVAGRPIELRAVRLDWSYDNGDWKQVEADPQSLTLASAAAPVTARFVSKEGGMYKIRADIADLKGRKNKSELTLWVAGGKLPPKRSVEQEAVTLIPDRKEYRPGETAEILVQSPFAPAEGLLTLRRAGLLSQTRFTMGQATTTLKVDLTEEHLPSLQLQVDLLGAAGRTDDAGELDPNLPPRPAFAAGSLSLPVSLASRTLSVTVQPRDTGVEPGGQTEVAVELRDAAGKPVAGGEVALLVVDEAVLSLSGYTLGDVLRTFYTASSPGVTDFHLRSNVQLANPEELTAEPQVRGAAPGRARMSMKGGEMDNLMQAPMAEGAALADGFGGDVAQAPIAVRSDFNPLAAFSPAVRTDAMGRAVVPVKMPDNLTRYRVMAVAVAGARQFGQAESTITARLPLMVRPSAPRFLNFGDRFELPVVVQNQTGSPIGVDVAVRATGVELLQGGGRRLTVPANDRVEVRFPMATLHAGTARFQIAAVSGRWADAAELSLPVWTPATTEAFATYGELDGGTKEAPAVTAQPVQAPGDVFPQFGGLAVTTSSTQLQALTDAVLYLVAYPFECAEQLSSRVLAVAALRDVLTAFEAEGLPKPEAMVAAVQRDVERLRGLQAWDGGFAFWRRGDETWPWISIHVAHALQRAKDKGFAVPDDMMERSRGYLKDVESHIPGWYGADTRRTLRAYALYVRKRMGDADPVKARGLFAEAKVEQWPLEALGWMLPVLAADKGSQASVDAILRHLQNRVAETAAGAHFVTGYGDEDYLLLHSDRRTDGVLLEALIEVQPSSDLIPKLVRGLLGHRTKGRWGNTQENAFILLALDRYFNTFEKETPDFVARIWLGEGFAGEHAFRGRTTERHHVEIPMRYVLEGSGPRNLVLSKDGPGRLYYRLGLSYAPKDLKLEPADHGFVVQRRYEAVGRPEDVKLDAEGTWHIRAGATVRVRLTMVAPARRTHVALVDPMPAGLEAMNPALAVTGSVPRDPAEQKTRGAWWWWSSVWYEHQNLRDERAEAFTSLLWEGVHEYSYVARATTPGVFVVPPPRAEEMYHPETFGRGATDRVIIE